MLLAGAKDILLISSSGKEPEVKMPTDVEVKPRLLPSEKARIREAGTPGPFENSICNAHHVMNTITGGAKSAVRNASSHEINKAAEEIISSLSEEGRFVGLEEVKARLCKDFGKLSLIEMGFRTDKDIPALKNLIELQAKVSSCKSDYQVCRTKCDNCGAVKKKVREVWVETCEKWVVSEKNKFDRST